ncbi:hypothetical protein [Streptomyces cyaneofuscatus]
MELLHLAQEKSGFWPTGAIMIVVIIVITVGIGIWRTRKAKKEG